MDVLSVDTASGKSGIVGVAELSDGVVLNTWELSPSTHPLKIMNLCRSVWQNSTVQRRLLVVERPYLGKSARELIGLVQTQERWMTIGHLMQATVLNPLATEWRSKSPRRQLRALWLWSHRHGVEMPRNRQNWKDLAVAFVRGSLHLDVSEHVAEAICMGLWGEEQATGSVGSILNGCEVLDGTGP